MTLWLWWDSMSLASHQSIRSARTINIHCHHLQSASTIILHNKTALQSPHSQSSVVTGDECVIGDQWVSDTVSLLPHRSSRTLNSKSRVLHSTLPQILWRTPSDERIAIFWRSVWWRQNYGLNFKDQQQSCHKTQDESLKTKEHTAIGGRCARDLRAKVCVVDHLRTDTSLWCARSFQTNYKFAILITLPHANGTTRARKLLRAFVQHQLVRKPSGDNFRDTRSRKRLIRIIDTDQPSRIKSVI
jgi:hypothetical protein